jgi:hypothetical protein
MLPLSVSVSDSTGSFAFSRRSAPRHPQVGMLPLSVTVSNSTGFLLHFRGVSSAASLRSGCYPLRSLLSRGTFQSFRGIALVRMLPGFVFAFSRLFEASATSLRSGCSPLSFLSRRRQLRGIAQVRMLPSFIIAFSRRYEASATSLRSGCSPPSLLSRGCVLRGITQVRMLPSFVFALSRLFEASAASLRSGCSPLSFLSRRRQLRGIAQVSMLPLSVTVRTARPALSRRNASFGLSGVSSALAPCFAVRASAASLGLDATPVRIGIRQSAGSIASRCAGSLV